MFKVPSTGDGVFLNKISFLLPGHIVNFIISRLAPGAKLNTFAKFSVIFYFAPLIITVVFVIIKSS